MTGLEHLFIQWTEKCRVGVKNLLDFVLLVGTLCAGFFTAWVRIFRQEPSTEEDSIRHTPLEHFSLPIT